MRHSSAELKLSGFLLWVCYEDVKVHLAPLGQPASEWYINRVDEDTIKFTVWNDPLNVGYRFRLSNEKAKEFAWFLDDINQYMLEHGVGI